MRPWNFWNEFPLLVPCFPETNFRFAFGILFYYFTHTDAQGGFEHVTFVGPLQWQLLESRARISLSHWKCLDSLFTFSNSSLALATCTFKTLRFSSISCRWQSKGLFSAFFGAVNFCSCEMRVRCWCERQMLRLLWLEFVRSWRTRHFHVHSSHFSR